MEVVICSGLDSQEDQEQKLKSRFFLSPDLSRTQRHTASHVWPGGLVHRGSRLGAIQEGQDRRNQGRASIVWLHFKQR